MTRRRPGARGDWGRGYRVATVRCIACGREWVGVIPIGTVGAQCPHCRCFDPQHYWGDPDPEIYCDGLWTTGVWIHVDVRRLSNRPYEAELRFGIFGNIPLDTGRGVSKSPWLQIPSA